MYLTRIDGLKEILKGDYSFRDGKAFFFEPPKDTELQPEEKRWTRWKKSNRKFFRRRLEKEDRSKVILDVGVGGGPFEKIFEEFRNVIGLDFYPYKNAILISDITRPLPLQNDSCDIIFMSNVLEHVPNPRDLLLECFRVLRPRGYVIATVPFLISIHRAPYDFHRYTNFMLEKMLRDANFRDIKIEILGSPLYLYEVMQRQFFSILPKSFMASLWKGASLLLSGFFRSFFKTVPADKYYVQGYGLFARK